VVGEQRLDAGRRARHRPRHAERQPAHVDRVQPVDVLVGVHLEQRSLEVDLLRRRVLHEHRVAGGVVVEAPDRRDDVGRRRVVGEPFVRAREAELLRLPHLHPDVAGRRAVTADQDGSEARPVAGCDQPLDAGREVGEDRLSDRGSRQQAGSHGAEPRTGGVRPAPARDRRRAADAQGRCGGRSVRA
jgi:hypothetical protein